MNVGIAAVERAQKYNDPALLEMIMVNAKPARDQLEAASNGVGTWLDEARRRITMVRDALL